MIKKLLIIIMIMTLSSVQLFDVQANTSVLSQLPEAIQERLYDRLNNQEDDTITETKLTASDGAANDFFGRAVAIDGSTLVVGAMYDDNVNGTNSGSVYVYDLTKDTSHTEFERKITASDGASNDYFGISVAIDGSNLVVGTINGNSAGSASGSVYVYDLTKATSDAGFERKITASDGEVNDYFGISVAIEGSILVVGARYDDDNGDNSGSVYVYDLTKATSDAGFERKVTASDGEVNDYFGIAVALDGSTLVVGAFYDDNNGSDSGSVYVYDLTKATSDTGFERKVTASDGASSDYFGYSVAIDGSTLVVGAYGDDDNGGASGSVYVYDLTKESGATGFERKVTASDGESSDYFGHSVALDSSTLVVGAYYDDDNGNSSGSVYVYDLTKATSDTGFERKATASDGASSDYFGYSVAIDGSTLVVGAYQADDNVNGTNSGSVYVYDGTFGSGTTKTDEEWASEITSMIDALTDPYVRADVEAARAAYDNLTEDQQALISAETYQTLLDAEQALADIDAAAAVDVLIDALTDPYDIEAIEAARTAYENLTETQQALVTGLLDLEEAEQRYEDINAASIVDGMIAALTEPYDLVAVYDARLAYDALTEIQKGYVNRFPELEAAELAVADQVAAAAVDALIDALTSPYVRADVEAAREAYNNLTETQQALVTGLLDLEAAEAGLVDQALAQAVELLINTLTAPYDSDAVQTASDAYSALTEAQQALVTNYQALLDAEQALADIDAAAAVDALIDALTEPYNPEAVQDARAAYENLTEAQQTLVTGLLDLELAEDTLMNETEAAGVDALIETLTEDSTEEEVEAVREAYENLTEEQQALVTGLPTLITYEQQFASPDSTGLVFFMIFFIGVISAVIYFGFYKRNKDEDEANIEQNKVQSKENDQEHSKDNFVSKTFIEKELKGLRERLQKKYDYAEFFIYSDEQLQHLIKAQPKTKAEFLKVKGFGEKKYKNFGKDVIKLFKTYKIK